MCLDIICVNIWEDWHKFLPFILTELWFYYVFNIMNLIFGTTSKRKVEDLQNIIHEMNLDIQVLSMEDIGWNRGEIDENGSTIEENSLIKAFDRNLAWHFSQTCYNSKYKHIVLYEVICYGALFWRVQRAIQ